MVGSKYWTVGISIDYYPQKNQWKAELKFYDDGFCQNESTEGSLHTRYYMDNPTEAIETLIQDAIKLGIKFENPILGEENIPLLYWPEAEIHDEPYNWQKILNDIAEKSGTKSAYQRGEIQHV